MQPKFLRTPKRNRSAGVHRKLIEIRQTVKQCRNVWKCKSPRRFDVVSAAFSQPTRFQRPIEHVQFGVAIIEMPRIVVALERECFEVLGERVVLLNQIVDRLEGITGVFDEYYAPQTNIRKVEPKTQSSVVVIKT